MELPLSTEEFFKKFSELSDKKAEFCRNSGPCPKCGTDQKQLIGWPENPSWKCRHCKCEFYNPL